MPIRATIWQSRFLYQSRGFQNRNLQCTFQMLFARKQGLAQPYILYENESFRHCLSYDLRKMTFLVLEVLFFQRVPFSGGLFFPTSRAQTRAQFLDDAIEIGDAEVGRCYLFCGIFFEYCWMTYIHVFGRN